MHRNSGIIGLGLSLLLTAGSGCAPQAGRSDAQGNTANSGRYGTNTLEIGPASGSREAELTKEQHAYLHRKNAEARRGSALFGWNIIW